jgi:hypothetical protein
VRIGLAGTAEIDRVEAAKPEITGGQAAMLTGEDERRHDATGRQGIGDRRHFDGFRPGPDDQPDVEETQYSP